MSLPHTIADRWQINCRTGALVDRIEFLLADGSVRGWGSTTGGTARDPFVLDDDEFLTGIEARHREWASNRGQTLLGR